MSHLKNKSSIKHMPSNRSFSPYDNSMRLPKILNSSYAKLNRIAALKNEFQKTGYVKLPSLLSDCFFEKIKKEIDRLYSLSVRKDFVMPGYETKRKMSVLSGIDIISSGDSSINLYSSKELRNFLEAVVGSKITTVRDKNEFIVANFLNGNEDTHGWHLDDPRYAFIVIIEAPSIYNGGCLEFIPNWHELTQKYEIDPILDIFKGVKIANSYSLIQKETFISGDCYLLDAGHALHRVSPLIGTGMRKALNFAFDDRQYRQYGETAKRLYG